MLNTVKRFFTEITSGTHSEGSGNREHDVRVAICALFVEMAKIDETFADVEMETILTILKEKYGLSGEHADELIAEADAELKKSVDLWQFARLINENYSPEEKIRIIEMLWQIVYVDGKLDKYEDYLMHKCGNLLRLSHKQLMDAKVKVLHAG
jgi:uncharacterized tellurite resistance protein B-like protein